MTNKMKSYIISIVFALLSVTCYTQDLQVSFQTKLVTEINQVDETETTRYFPQEFYFNYDTKSLVHILVNEGSHQIYIITDVQVKEIENECMIVITQVTSQQGDKLNYIFHILMCSDGTQSLALDSGVKYLVYHN